MHKYIVAALILVVTVSAEAGLQRGDLLLAGERSVDLYNGFSHWFVPVEYFVDHYDERGTFMKRVLTGTPVPTEFTLNPIESIDEKTVLFAAESHIVRRLNGDGSPGDRFGGDFRSVSDLVGDASGNVYVADYRGYGQGEVIKHDRDGNILDRYSLDVSSSMDLASDQCTLVYPRLNIRGYGDVVIEWFSIEQYDLCSHSELPGFTEQIYPTDVMRLRILPDGGLLILNGHRVERRSPAGTLVWTLTNDDLEPFVLMLDPTAGSFWVATYSAALLRYDTADGALLAGPLPIGAGLGARAATVIGGWRAGRRNVQPREGPHIRTDLP